MCRRRVMVAQGLDPTDSHEEAAIVIKKLGVGCGSLIAIIIVIIVISQLVSGGGGSKKSPATQVAAASTQTSAVKGSSSKTVTTAATEAKANAQAGQDITQAASKPEPTLTPTQAATKAAPTPTPKPSKPTPTPTTAPPTPTPTPSGPATTFGDGMYRVGSQIAPGTYWTNASLFCYWERLSGFTGDLSDILANDNTQGQTIVTIETTDKGFHSQRCGDWRPISSLPKMTGKTSFVDGTYLVGSDYLQPGTYQSDGKGGQCYWARLSGFSGSLDEIVANNNVSGPTIVTISASDKGFEAHRCGTWTRTTP